MRPCGGSDLNLNINWYPGHMAKATRLIGESMREVDLVVELCDARIPQASRNPVLMKQIGDKPHILFMNKADLADPAVTEQWIAAYQAAGADAMAGSAFEAGDRQQLIDRIFQKLSGRIQQTQARGLRDHPVRLMMIGIPNCGKSTLINAMARRKAAAAEDRPGVTRGRQWIRTSFGYDMMDMPGVLWPRLGSRHNQIALACTGAIKDQILDIESVAFETLNLLCEHYPDAVTSRMKLTALDGDPYERFQAAARRRGCVRSGGRTDDHRFAMLLLDEFRSGVIGRISLERPGDAMPDETANEAADQETDGI